METSTRFHVIDIATEAAGIALRIAATVPAPFRSIGDQLIRAAASVPANLSEGSGRTGRDRLHHFRIALGEAREVDVHLNLLVKANAVDPTDAHRSDRLFDSVRAITWQLLHP